MQWSHLVLGCVLWQQVPCPPRGKDRTGHPPIRAGRSRPRGLTPSDGPGLIALAPRADGPAPAFDWLSRTSPPQWGSGGDTYFAAGLGDSEGTSGRPAGRWWRKPSGCRRAPPCSVVLWPWRMPWPRTQGRSRQQDVIRAYWRLTRRWGNTGFVWTRANTSEPADCLATRRRRPCSARPGLRRPRPSGVRNWTRSGAARVVRGGGALHESAAPAACRSSPRRALRHAIPAGLRIPQSAPKSPPDRPHPPDPARGDRETDRRRPSLRRRLGGRGGPLRQGPGGPVGASWLAWPIAAGSAGPSWPRSASTTRTSPSMSSTVVGPSASPQELVTLLIKPTSAGLLPPRQPALEPDPDEPTLAPPRRSASRRAGPGPGNLRSVRQLAEVELRVARTS